jgi:hypothetical protein
VPSRKGPAAAQQEETGHRVYPKRPAAAAEKSDKAASHPLKGSTISKRGTAFLR